MFVCYMYSTLYSHDKVEENAINKIIRENMFTVHMCIIEKKNCLSVDLGSVNRCYSRINRVVCISFYLPVSAKKNKV